MINSVEVPFLLGGGGASVRGLPYHVNCQPLMV